MLPAHRPLPASHVRRRRRAAGQRSGESDWQVQKPLVLPPPVVRLPLELDRGLLRQCYCLLEKGRDTIFVYRGKFGGRHHLW
jgi:hypothetical protein